MLISSVSHTLLKGVNKLQPELSTFPDQSGWNSVQNEDPHVMLLRNCELHKNQHNESNVLFTGIDEFQSIPPTSVVWFWWNSVEQNCS